MLTREQPFDTAAVQQALLCNAPLQVRYATNTRADEDDDNNDDDDSDVHGSDGMEDDEFDADDFI